MKWIEAIFKELVGLFIDDGSFATAILAWLAAVWVALPRLLPAAWHAPIFFVGLLVILFESVLRRARRR